MVCEGCRAARFEGFWELEEIEVDWICSLNRKDFLEHWEWAFGSSKTAGQDSLHHLMIGFNVQKID